MLTTILRSALILSLVLSLVFVGMDFSPPFELRGGFVAAIDDSHGREMSALGSSLLQKSKESHHTLSHIFAHVSDRRKVNTWPDASQKPGERSDMRLRLRIRALEPSNNASSVQRPCDRECTSDVESNWAGLCYDLEKRHKDEEGSRAESFDRAVGLCNRGWLNHQKGCEYKCHFVTSAVFSSSLFRATSARSTH